MLICLVSNTKLLLWPLEHAGWEQTKCTAPLWQCVVNLRCTIRVCHANGMGQIHMASPQRLQTKK